MPKWFGGLYSYCEHWWCPDCGEVILDKEGEVLNLHSPACPRFQCRVENIADSSTADSDTTHNQTTNEMQEEAVASTAQPTHDMEATVIKFKKVNEKATWPTRATPLSAGLDLYAALYFTIEPNQRVVTDTFLQVQLPPNHCGQIISRSGLAAEKGLTVLGGLIDEDYRGNLKVILLNTGDKTVYIKKGDRIAQLVCVHISYPLVEEVETLSETLRGAKGLGSSGK
jgi:dUTP pyrophosphatase